MNRHNPTVRRSTVGGSPALIYEPPTNARSIAAVVENHSSITVRLLFTDTGSLPDPDAYISLAPGLALETNPDLNVYAYTSSGASAEVVVVTGVRHVGSIDQATASGLLSAADLLAEQRSHRLMMAELVVIGRVMLRYMAEWQGEEFKQSDALEI